MRAALFWSGGKDSAMAFEMVLPDPGIEVTCLVTTLTGAYDRISMHGVRRTLLERQAAAIGLPLRIMYGDKVGDLPQGNPDAGFTAFPSNETYEANLHAMLGDLQVEGIEAIVFGDIYLEDLRAYREALVRKFALQAVFPLWQRATDALIEDIVATGIVTRIVCADSTKMGKGWIGTVIAADFADSLPEGIDPCGENGEFHTFVTDAPAFARPVICTAGETVLRDGFWFGDLLPG